MVIAYPVVYNLIVSFTDASLMYPGLAYVGVENYQIALGDPTFWERGFSIPWYGPYFR